MTQLCTSQLSLKRGPEQTIHATSIGSEKKDCFTGVPATTYRREIAPDIIACNNGSARGHTGVSSEDAEGGSLASSIDT